jgi:hypothetical protein
MQRNIDYIGDTLIHHPEDFTEYLRRGNMIAKLSLKKPKAP